MQTTRWVTLLALVSVAARPVEAGPKVLRKIATAIYGITMSTTLAPVTCGCVTALCAPSDPILVCGAGGMDQNGNVSRDVSFGFIGPVSTGSSQGCEACACNLSDAAAITLEPVGECLSLTGRHPAVSAPVLAGPQKLPRY